MGDTLSFQVQTSLPAGWFVFFVLNAVLNNVPSRILIGRDSNGNNLNAVDVNGLATFTAPGSVTGAWPAGRYEWVMFSIDLQGNRTEMTQGQVILLADVAGASPVDDRSYNRKCLDSIRTVIQGSVLDDTMMYKIGTRELTKISRKELLELEAVFEGRVNRERRRRGEILPKRGLGVHFGRC